ncbi:MAG: hypothetical protein U1E25_15135 [Methylocystis sp.]
MNGLAKTENANSPAPAETPDSNGRILEENLREAMDLSRALWMLMVGLRESYPHQIEERDLAAIYQLASEISDRTREANRQWHEDQAA